MLSKKIRYSVLLFLLPVCVINESLAAPVKDTAVVDKTVVDKTVVDKTEADKTVVVKAAPQNREFAVIGDTVIKENEFLFALEKGVRDKFFHGKVSRDEMDAFKKTVAEKLVSQTLLYQEAMRRKLVLDKDARAGVERRLDKYTGANTNVNKKKDPSAESDKLETSESLMRKLLERDALVKALENQIKQVSAPTDAQKQQYYKDNNDKFTAPEEWHISLIMLKVDPSSPGQVWQDTTDFAMDLLDQLRDGLDFAEAAYIHSSDTSAMDGGDMGYVHIGMLAKPAQDVLNLMDLKQISEPVFLLQGVAIFRLEDIKGSRLNTYKKVQDRLIALLSRQSGLDAWGKLLLDLKEKVTYKINEEVIQAAMAKGQ